MTDLQIVQEPIFEFIPPEILIRWIKDEDLAKLFIKHYENITMKQVGVLCGWFEEDKKHEICMDCLKNSKRITKVGNEKDMLTFLVQENVIPEGNYLVLIT